MPPDKWVQKAEITDLPLAERFTIARQTWDVATSVFVTVECDGVAGLGEAQPAERWDETPQSVVRQVEDADLSQLSGVFDLEGVLELLPPGSARSALDIALHDLAARTAGISVAELLGTGGRRLPPTSITVPIARLPAMVERARSLAAWPILKVKVGFDGDVDAVAAVRSVHQGRIRIDANEGWRDADEALDRLDRLSRYDIELCEQPVPADRRSELAEVSKGSPIPVFADEDVCTATDVVALASVVHGVNLKVRKAGGLRAIVQAVAAARACGLQVMLGCDLESGVGSTAAASIASLADFVDLDGFLLLAADPRPGVSCERGTLRLPAGPGLGVAR